MIDGGLSRAARPAGRQIVYRDEPARQYPDEYQRSDAPAESRQKQRQAQTDVAPETARKPRNLSWVKWPLLLTIVIAIAATAWFFMPSQNGVASAIDTGKYQAVFLSNGQVYFGRLSVVNNDYMKLTNIYYLERQLSGTGDTEIEGDTGSATVNATDNNFQLLKYSDVLYGSEDAMVISKDDIIRFENLRSDGVVAKAIANRS